MALTEETEYDKIETVQINGLKSVQVRKATIIKKDGNELSRTFHRHVVVPGKLDADKNWFDTDLSNEAQEVKDICTVVFTQAQKDKWKTHLTEQADSRTPL